MEKSNNKNKAEVKEKAFDHQKHVELLKASIKNVEKNEDVDFSKIWGVGG